MILNEYEKYSLPSECMIDYDAIIEKRDAVEVLNRMWSDEENIDLVMEDSKVRSRLFLMEYVILDLLHAGKCEADGFIVAYTNKMCEKLHSEYFKGETIESITQAIGDPQAEQMILNYYGLNPATARSSYTVYTPGNHTAVTCNYTSTLTMCNYSDYAASIASAHGTLISLASTTFNCHSFAWLKNLYSSNYQHLWMNSASAFAADSYYSSQSSPSAAGRIAYSGLHSAVVQQTSMPNPNHYNIPEPYVVSKWSAGPIVSHFLSEGFPGSYTFYYH